MPRSMQLEINQVAPRLGKRNQKGNFPFMALAAPVLGALAGKAMGAIVDKIRGNGLKKKKAHRKRY